jgi:hypothetical protein
MMDTISSRSNNLPAGVSASKITSWSFPRNLAKELFLSDAMTQHYFFEEFIAILAIPFQI